MPAGERRRHNLLEHRPLPDNHPFDLGNHALPECGNISRGIGHNTASLVAHEALNDNNYLFQINVERRGIAA